MSDSERSKELGGLARSIDSLFSSRPSPEEEEADQESGDGSGSDAKLDAAAAGVQGESHEIIAADGREDGEGDFGMEPVDEEVAPDAAEPPVEVLPVASASVETARVIVETASDTQESERDEPQDEAAGPAPHDSESAEEGIEPLGEAAGAGVTPDEVATTVEIGSDEPMSDEIAADEASTDEVEADGSMTEKMAADEATTDEVEARESAPADLESLPDALEPGPLALAVEAFLAGGGDSDRVRTLAAGHLEAREFEPAAEAVERLVLASVQRDDPAPMQLASELLNPIVLGRMVRRLGGERNESRRRELHGVCTALGEEMAIAIRDEMAEATDRFARRAYFDALVAMGETSRPVIEAMAEDENRFLARNGVAILGEVGGPGAVELVVGALANSDPRVRREALLSMARLKVQDADEIVVGRLVDDTEPSVRLAAVIAAGELRVERAARPLIAALEEAYETDEVLPLLRALGQIADPGAVAAIEKHAVRALFAPPRTEVRIAAYQALTHIGTPHARRLVNQAVSDKDPAVKAAAKDLLGMR